MAVNNSSELCSQGQAILDAMVRRQAGAFALALLNPPEAQGELFVDALI